MSFPLSPRAARRSNQRAAGLVAALSVVTLTGLALAAPASAATATAPASAPAALPAQAVVVTEPTVASPLVDIVAAAEQAVDDAHAAARAAGALSADVAASGLSLGAGPVSVDTTALLAKVAELGTVDLVPALFLPDLTEQLDAQTAEVTDATTALAKRLDAAEEKKAAAEAAARKKAAAKKAAAAKAAAAAAAAQADADAASGSGSAPSAGNSVGAAKATARSLASSSYGWGDDQFSCLVSLWQRESGWNYRAANPSGAYGIPQALPGSKMASAGSDWRTNASTQIAWGLRYIKGAYGSPCKAWSHSESTGWY